MGGRQSRRKVAQYRKVAAESELKLDPPPEYADKEVNRRYNGMDRIARLFESSEKLDPGLCGAQLDRIADMLAPELGVQRFKVSTAKILYLARKALAVGARFRVVPVNECKFDDWEVVAS